MSDCEKLMKALTLIEEAADLIDTMRVTPRGFYTLIEAEEILTNELEDTHQC